MSTPFLSVVIPSYNEEGRIRASIARVVEYLSVVSYSWEIVVADDGSEDRTAAIVESIAGSHREVRLVRVRHGGKGWAVKHGMLSATGQWRFMCDADLAMPPNQIERFFVGKGGEPPFDICIGSREAPGARRFHEPWGRHLAGRAFNIMVRLVAVQGLNDTQCGFKLFRGEAVEGIFGRQRMHGFAFDVELLLLAKKAGLTIGEIAIDWYHTGSSSVSLALGASAFVDVVRIQLNDLLGRYRAPERQ